MGSRECLTIRLLIGASHIEDVLQKQTGPAIQQEKTKLHGKKLSQGEQHPYYNLVLSCLLSPHLALPWMQRKERGGTLQPAKEGTQNRPLGKGCARKMILETESGAEAAPLDALALFPLLQGPNTLIRERFWPNLWALALQWPQ